MADSYVSVPNSGSAKVDAEELTVNSETVERQRVQVAGSTAAAIAAVLNSDPSTEYALVVRNIPSGTQAISAVSLPLPTGAATSAKQPALGTAGSPSADILTVQGAGSMTPLLVDGSGVTQPVSGPLTDAQLRASSVNAAIPSHTASGSIGASDASVSVTLNGSASAVMDKGLAGTFRGTLVPEYTIDGTNWFSTWFYDLDDSALSTSRTYSFNFTERYGIMIPGGAAQVRVRCSAYTSGTTTVTLVANQGSYVTLPLVKAQDAIAGPFTDGPGTLQMNRWGGLRVAGQTDQDIAGSATWSSATALDTSLDATNNIAAHYPTHGIMISCDGGTFSAGQISFEVSNDGASVWWPISVTRVDAAETVGTVTLSPNLKQAYTVSTTAFHYLRIRLSQAITGTGTVSITHLYAGLPDRLNSVVGQADATKLQATVRISDGTDTALVSASGALLVDGSATTQPISGTVTANAGTGNFTVVQSTASSLNAQVVGPVAHDSPDTPTNPVKVGGKAALSQPAAVAANDVANAWTDLSGRQVIAIAHPAQVANDSVGATASGPKVTTLTGTGDVALVSAQGASLSIYVTLITITNTSSTATRVDIKDGSTTRMSMFAAADGGGAVIPFNVPWKITANTALNGALGTGVTDVRVTVHYFVAA